MTLDLDRHIRRESFKRYALQCGLAGFVVLILLLVLDAVTQTVLIAALGASAFIAFAVPRSLHSGARHMIGGYAQQSYGFNYYGTVGANRDEFVVVRKMEKVDWLDREATAKEAAE